MKSASEKDWKAFKRIRARALDRFARRALDACRELIDKDEEEAVGRMLSLFDFLRQERKKFRRIEEHQGRSSILIGLLHFRALDLLDDQDLASLSPETRASIEAVGK